MFVLRRDNMNKIYALKVNPTLLRRITCIQIIVIGSKDIVYYIVNIV